MQSWQNLTAQHKLFIIYDIKIVPLENYPLHVKQHEGSRFLFKFLCISHGLIDGQPRKYMSTKVACRQLFLKFLCVLCIPCDAHPSVKKAKVRVYMCIEGGIQLQGQSISQTARLLDECLSRLNYTRPSAETKGKQLRCKCHKYVSKKEQGADQTYWCPIVRNMREILR